ncbi:hypothetical protein ACUXV3_20230 (plasmid) [Roseobacteraceae bacterium NS-SX3]
MALRYIYLLAGLCTAAAVAAASGGRPVRIVLDPEQRFQTISGWEATADLPDAPAAPHWQPYEGAMLERAVNAAGINRLRLEVRSGAETGSGRIRRFIAGHTSYEDWKHTRYLAENDNDDPFTINWDGFDFAELDWHAEHSVLPVRALLAARGERLVLNLCLVDFEPGPPLHGNPEEYAEFMLAASLHLRRKYGLVPDLWEVMLEPDLVPGGWTGAQMGAAMAATAARLKAHGFRPAFAAPSVMNMKNALPYVQAIAAVPGARDHWAELSYHRYRGRSPRRLRQIAQAAARLGLRTSMLEWWFGHATYEVLHEDLTLGQVSAWQGRVLQGLFVTRGWPQAGLPPRAEVAYTQQYFRAIRTGAVRIGAASSAPRAFAPAAFVHPDGRHAVVIKAARAGRAVVEGLPPGRYRLSWTVEASSGPVEGKGPAAAGADGRLRVEIPGRGVLAITAAQARSTEPLPGR